MSDDNAPTQLLDPICAQRIAQDLRERAAKVRTWSSVVLFCVVILMIAGLNIFVRAGELAKSEVGGVSKTAKVLEYNAGILRDWSKRIGDRIEAKVEFNQRTGKTTKTEPKWNEVATYLGRVERLLEKSAMDISAASAKTEDAAARMTAEFESNARTAVLIQTVATRTGILLIIIFMLQTLLGIYKYSARLNAGLNTRADALELLGSTGSAADFESIVKSLAVDHLDFGKTGRPPAQDMVELAKALSASGKIKS